MYTILLLSILSHLKSTFHVGKYSRSMDPSWVPWMTSRCWHTAGVPGEIGTSPWNLMASHWNRCFLWNLVCWTYFFKILNKKEVSCCLTINIHFFKTYLFSLEFQEMCQLMYKSLLVAFLKFQRQWVCLKTAGAHRDLISTTRLYMGYEKCKSPVICRDFHDNHSLDWSYILTLSELYMFENIH